MEKRASCWLNALFLKRCYFDLTKGEFRDGVALRYGWDHVKLPSICPCGENFNVVHALHCPKGGCTHIRHNCILDSFANLLRSSPVFRLCKGKPSQIELPVLRTFFDVKVVNSYAKSCPRSIPDSYKYHEYIKKLKYEQRIIKVKKAAFCPLIISLTGGAGPSASKAMQRLDSRISDKKEDSYSDVITYIRTKLSFALLRSFILCLRGARSMRLRPAVEAAWEPM